MATQTGTVDLNDKQRKATQDLLDHLYAIRQKLMMVDPNSLNADDHAAWTEQIYQVSLAIGYVVGLDLDNVNNEYANLLPKAKAATDKVTDDLYSLQDNVKAIGVIADVLGTIEKIAALAG